MSGTHNVVILSSSVKRMCHLLPVTTLRYKRRHREFAGTSRIFLLLQSLTGLMLQFGVFHSIERFFFASLALWNGLLESDNS